MNWRNSLCKFGRYHEYQIIQTGEYTNEICIKCKKQLRFKSTVPNYIYLSHHLSLLQYAPN